MRIALVPQTFVLVLSAAVFLSIGAGFAGAKPLRIAVSIPPLHSLVAAVTKGVHAPALIAPGTVSPHTHQLTPSVVAEIEQSDLVFWVGLQLETFLVKVLETNADKTPAYSIIEAPGVIQLAFRDDPNFEAHVHHDEHEHDDHDNGHDDHANTHDHDDHNDDHNGEHDHEDDGEDEHGHEDEAKHGIDPHVWLDPKNAVAIAAFVLEKVAAADPENAAAYSENFEVLKTRLTELETAMATVLSSSKDKPYIVFHDGYQYLENRFGIEVAAAVSFDPEIRPSAKRILDIRQTIERANAACIFSEPQFNPKIVSTIAETTDAEIATLDPMGAGLEPGPDLYPRLMSDIAQAISECSKKAN